MDSNHDMGIKCSCFERGLPLDNVRRKMKTKTGELLRVNTFIIRYVVQKLHHRDPFECSKHREIIAGLVEYVSLCVYMFHSPAHLMAKTSSGQIDAVVIVH